MTATKPELEEIEIEMPRRTRPQKMLDESRTRFNLGVWGRQSGKTTWGYRKMLWKPMQSKENSVFWHILQTYSAADIVYDRYLRFIHPHRDQLVTYKSDTARHIQLIGNRNVFFKSGQNFEDLRTESLDGAIIDEARQQKKELWSMVIFPMLSKANGWGDILTSPNGFDWIYDKKVEKANDPNWNVVHVPSTEAWWWTPEQIAEAKKNMTDMEFRQEIMAEFVNISTGKAYVSFGDYNLLGECPFASGKLWSPYVPVVAAMDFNLSPMCWNMGQLNSQNWWWFDEIHIEGATKRPVNEEAAIMLRDKVLIMKESGFRGEPNVIVCGDFTGKATQRTSNESDYHIIFKILKDAGITYRDETLEMNPPVKDRVNAVNVKCRSAGGDINLHIHPQYCPHLVKDMERVAWKTGGDFILDPGPQKMFGHHSDAIGYPIFHLTPVKAVRTIGKTRIIQRTI